MKQIKIDEYLVVNIYTQKKRWLQVLPRRLQAYEVAIRVKGFVNIPDMLPIIELGEIKIPDIETEVQAQAQAEAQAQMG